VARVLSFLQFEDHLLGHRKLKAHTSDELLAPSLKHLRHVAHLDVKGPEYVGMGRRPMPAVDDRIQITRKPGPYGSEMKPLFARRCEVGMEKQWGMIRGTGRQSTECMVWVQIAPTYTSKGRINLRQAWGGVVRYSK
jgi:hypothetical protein